MTVARLALLSALCSRIQGPSECLLGLSRQDPLKCIGLIRVSGMNLMMLTLPDEAIGRSVKLLLLRMTIGLPGIRHVPVTLESLKMPLYLWYIWPHPMWLPLMVRIRRKWMLRLLAVAQVPMGIEINLKETEFP